MKKLIVAIVICICIMAGSHILGYCQEDVVGESLETEITGEGNESEAEITEANVEFDAGEPMD